jgi:CDP-paratose 2-epimerase
MKILITGICGFVGSNLARWFRENVCGSEIFGLDNLVRTGTARNLAPLRVQDCRIFHGDIRQSSDLALLPPVDWIIDAAANPSVLAGVDGRASSRQVVEHNLIGTINLLEKCREVKAGLVLLSTSRVYSIAALAAIPLRHTPNRFEFDLKSGQLRGVSERGINEDFPTDPPVSLYGATKLSSEILALEYGKAYGFPVWINRCGVLAGAGQFGTAEQGIFSYWLHGWKAGRRLRYIGFGGRGLQLRDAFHPVDLAELISRQLADADSSASERLWNLGGGLGNSMSLAELSAWAQTRFGRRTVEADPGQRPFDVPWVVMDSQKARTRWDWTPKRSLEAILDEIADHVEKNPDWLELCTA